MPLNFQKIAYFLPTHTATELTAEQRQTLYGNSSVTPAYDYAPVRDNWNSINYTAYENQIDALCKKLLDIVNDPYLYFNEREKINPANGTLFQKIEKNKYNYRYIIETLRKNIQFRKYPNDIYKRQAGKPLFFAELKSALEVITLDLDSKLKKIKTNQYSEDEKVGLLSCIDDLMQDASVCEEGFHSKAVLMQAKISGQKGVKGLVANRLDACFHQMGADHCQSKLREIEVMLADPMISPQDGDSLRSQRFYLIHNESHVPSFFKNLAHAMKVFPDEMPYRESLLVPTFVETAQGFKLNNPYNNLMLCDDHLKAFRSWLDRLFNPETVIEYLADHLNLQIRDCYSNYQRRNERNPGTITESNGMLMKDLEEVMGEFGIIHTFGYFDTPVIFYDGHEITDDGMEQTMGKPDFDPSKLITTYVLKSDLEVNYWCNVIAASVLLKEGLVTGEDEFKNTAKFIIEDRNDSNKKLQYNAGQLTKNQPCLAFDSIDDLEKLFVAIDQNQYCDVQTLVAALERVPRSKMQSFFKKALLDPKQRNTAKYCLKRIDDIANTYQEGIYQKSSIYNSRELIDDLFKLTAEDANDAIPTSWFGNRPGQLIPHFFEMRDFTSVNSARKHNRALVDLILRYPPIISYYLTNVPARKELEAIIDYSGMMMTLVGSGNKEALLAASSDVVVNKIRALVCNFETLLEYRNLLCGPLKQYYSGIIPETNLGMNEFFNKIVKSSNPKNYTCDHFITILSYFLSDAVSGDNRVPSGSDELITAYIQFSIDNPRYEAGTTFRKRAEQIITTFFDKTNRYDIDRKVAQSIWGLIGRISDKDFIKLCKTVISELIPKIDSIHLLDTLLPYIEDDHQKSELSKRRQQLKQKYNKYLIGHKTVEKGKLVIETIDDIKDICDASEASDSTFSHKLSAVIPVRDHEENGSKTRNILLDALLSDSNQPIAKKLLNELNVFDEKYLSRFIREKLEAKLSVKETVDQLPKNWLAHISRDDQILLIKASKKYEDLERMTNLYEYSLLKESGFYKVFCRDIRENNKELLNILSDAQFIEYCTALKERIKQPEIIIELASSVDQQKRNKLLEKFKETVKKFAQLFEELLNSYTGHLLSPNQILLEYREISRLHNRNEIFEERKVNKPRILILETFNDLKEICDAINASHSEQNKEKYRQILLSTINAMSDSERQKLDDILVESITHDKTSSQAIKVISFIDYERKFPSNPNFVDKLLAIKSFNLAMKRIPKEWLPTIPANELVRLLKDNNRLNIFREIHGEPTFRQILWDNFELIKNLFVNVSENKRCSIPIQYVSNNSTTVSQNLKKYFSTLPDDQLAALIKFMTQEPTYSPDPSAVDRFICNSMLENRKEGSYHHIFRTLDLPDSLFLKLFLHYPIHHRHPYHDRLNLIIMNWINSYGREKDDSPLTEVIMTVVPQDLKWERAFMQDPYAKKFIEIFIRRKLGLPMPLGPASIVTMELTRDHHVVCYQDTENDCYIDWIEPTFSNEEFPMTVTNPYATKSKQQIYHSTMPEQTFIQTYILQPSNVLSVLINDRRVLAFELRFQDQVIKRMRKDPHYLNSTLNPFLIREYLKFLETHNSDPNQIYSSWALFHCIPTGDFKVGLELLHSAISRAPSSRAQAIESMTQIQFNHFISFLLTLNTSDFELFNTADLMSHLESRVRQLLSENMSADNPLRKNFSKFLIKHCVYSKFVSPARFNSLMKFINDNFTDDDQDNLNVKMINIYLPLFVESTIVPQSNEANIIAEHLTIVCSQYINPSNFEAFLSNIHPSHWSRVIGIIEETAHIPEHYDFSFIANLADSRAKVPTLYKSYLEGRSVSQRLENYVRKSTPTDPDFFTKLRGFCENHVISENELPAIKKLFAHHLATLYREGTLKQGFASGTDPLLKSLRQ